MSSKRKTTLFFQCIKKTQFTQLAIMNYFTIFCGHAFLGSCAKKKMQFSIKMQFIGLHKSGYQVNIFLISP